MELGLEIRAVNDIANSLMKCGGQLGAKATQDKLNSLYSSNEIVGIKS